MRVLGINAVFHDPAAALVVDGEIAAAEEERFSRRTHGKSPVPSSAWEPLGESAGCSLEHAGLFPADLDGIAYSYDPALVPGEREALRTLYALRAPLFGHRGLGDWSRITKGYPILWRGCTSSRSPISLQQATGILGMGP